MENLRARQREALRKSADEMADSINENFREIRSQKMLKLIGIDSLSVLSGLTAAGLTRALGLESMVAVPVIIAFAMPNLLMANFLPKPNKLSPIINYETAKYLMAAATVYSDKIYEAGCVAAKLFAQQ